MKTKVLLLLIMVSSLKLFAQNEGRPPEVERQALALKSELSLTDEQFARLKDINDQFRIESGRLRADKTLAREKMFEERKIMLGKRDSLIRGMLTEEQRVKWQAMRKRDGRPGNSARTVNPMEDLRKAVGFDDEQSKKIMALNGRMMGELKKLRSDTTVTRQDAGNAKKKIMEERNAGIKAILTEEQYKKFVAYEAENVRNRRREGRSVRP